MRRGRLGYLSPDALSGFGPSLLGALFLHVHSYHQAAPPQSSSDGGVEGTLSSTGHTTSEADSQLQTPGLPPASAKHWPPPDRSRPEPRKATPSAGSVGVLGLAGGGWGALGSPSPDTQSHTHRWEWGGMLGQEPKFTGCSPWLVREKKLTSTALHKHPFT